MKIHLLPLLLLAANFSGTPAPAKREVIIKDDVDVSSKNAVNENEMIAWKTERRLSWDDFLCSPQKAGDAVASTSTSLGISYQVKDNQVSYDISCYFSKKKSWGALKTDYILAHEQAHFDITELYARKLYEALYNYQLRSATYKQDIETIYQSIVKQKEAMQETYDRETDHSRKKRIQYEWLDKIDGMLDETERFASYP